MFAKSRSSVTKTRSSARQRLAIWVSSAPMSRGSKTLSASKPALQRRTAHSAGKFSSILAFNCQFNGKRRCALTCQFRCVRECRVNIDILEGRVALQQLFALYTRGQVIQDHRNQHTRPEDTCLAMTECGVDTDAILQPAHHAHILHSGGIDAKASNQSI